MSKNDRLIGHYDALPKYGPPGHVGATNVRLLDRDFEAGFELVHGTLEPGGIADRHNHEREYQAIYVIEGSCLVTLGDEETVTCTPGSVIRIPPGVDHEVVNKGSVPTKMLIVYRPPLPPRDDTPMTSQSPI